MKRYIVELIRKAVTDLPADVEEAMEKAYKKEKNKIARLQFKNILENVKLARRLKAPLCQDTGLPVFYVSLGKNEKFKKIEKAIIEGLTEATKKIPLRANVVDPLNRKNTDSLPIINWKFSSSETTEIIFFPKGAGSENMSCFKMLTPADGLDGIKNLVLEVVKNAGGKPCPPTIIGVGIGGSFDAATKLAKEALLRPLNSYNKRKEVELLEKQLLKEINALEIGAMGLGGAITALKVNIEVAPCHIASLPVAINMECWAHRAAKMRIKGRMVEFL